MTQERLKELLNDITIHPVRHSKDKWIHLDEKDVDFIIQRVINEHVKEVIGEDEKITVKDYDVDSYITWRNNLRKEQRKRAGL